MRNLIPLVPIFGFIALFLAGDLWRRRLEARERAQRKPARALARRVRAAAVPRHDIGGRA